MNCVIRLLTACFIGILLLFPYVVNAGPSELSYDDPEEEIYDCLPTPEIDSSDTYPGNKHVFTTNNLRRMSGSGFFAEGKKIYVRGRIFDESCLPVSGARVQIWHANAYGRFKSDVDDSLKEDLNFAGSGEFKTNNLGEFSFITIKPGIAKGDKYPFINIMIYKDDLSTMATRMYLVDDKDKNEKESYESGMEESVGASGENTRNDSALTPPDAVRQEIDLSDKHRNLIAKKRFTNKIPTYIFNVTLPHQEELRTY